MTDTLSGRAIRPADCTHADECDCELISLCPACGEPIDYCQGHGAIGDPHGFAVLAAHDADRHDDCHPAGCDYLYQHTHKSHALCHPGWCAWRLDVEGSRFIVEHMTAEELVESLHVLFRHRGHFMSVARTASDACRVWLEANPPAYTEPEA